MAIYKLFTPLLFFSAFFVLSAEEWYISAPGGIPEAQLSGSGPSEEGWTLSIASEDDKEIRNLYKDGVLQSITVLVRSNGRLMAREESDPEGNLLSRVEYAWDAEGNPRAVYIASGEGGIDRVESDRKVGADGIVWRHASSSGEDWIVTDRDEAGRPLEQLSLSGPVVTEETSWKRSDDGELKERIEHFEDEIRSSKFDDKGRLIEENTTRGGLVVLTRTYQWKDDDLIRVEERGEGRLSVREISWSGNRMVGETKSIDGIRVSRTEWISENERIETLFRDGEAVVRVYWRDGNRVKEEFLRDGEVIRTREDIR